MGRKVKNRDNMDIVQDAFEKGVPQWSLVRVIRGSHQTILGEMCRSFVGGA